MRTPSFRPFRSLLALPLACASMAASAATYNVVDYGAKGGDIRADTAAIQRTIDACSAHGGGQVLVPAGAHYTIATLVLKSHV
ncbi:MAG: glycosyl hydrolase family 28-related protein, partial [Opitutaceae bacterium]